MQVTKLKYAGKLKQQHLIVIKYSDICFYMLVAFLSQNRWTENVITEWEPAWPTWMGGPQLVQYSHQMCFRQRQNWERTSFSKLHCLMFAITKWSSAGILLLSQKDLSSCFRDQEFISLKKRLNRKLGCVTVPSAPTNIHPGTHGVMNQSKREKEEKGWEEQ